VRHAWVWCSPLTTSSSTFHKMGSAVSSPISSARSSPLPKIHQQKKKKNKNQSHPHPSDHLLTLPSDNLLSHLIQQESHLIRCKILHDIPLQFLQKTIIILYGPPLSHCEELGSYLAKKFKFPFHSSLSDSSPSGSMVSSSGLRLGSGEDDHDGCLLINCPRSVDEGESFNNKTKEYKKVVLLIEQDFTVDLSFLSLISLSACSSLALSVSLISSSSRNFSDPNAEIGSIPPLGESTTSCPTLPNQ
jgi:hypothetical protein